MGCLEVMLAHGADAMTADSSGEPLGGHCGEVSEQCRVQFSSSNVFSTTVPFSKVSLLAAQWCFEGFTA